MIKILLISAALVAVAQCRAHERPAERQEEERLAVAPARLPTQEELAQNANAKYEFSSNVEDHINDQSQQRVEVRDGVNVKGMYSYSDGYYRRTIHYEADDKGYRVTNMEIVPLEGPKIDLNGKASIDTAAHGTQLKYTVQSVPSDGTKVDTPENF